jgi:hypothetical protein
VNSEYLKILRASVADRRDLFLSAASRLGAPESNIEKDFWVCWTLDALFNGLDKGSPRLLFKGGTSLSKAYGLISRFSEDIDITVYREDIGQQVSALELEALSKKKRQVRLDAIKAACQEYIRGSLCQQLNRIVNETLGAAGLDQPAVRFVLDEEDLDGQSLLFWYPSVMPGDAECVRAVKIESGAKSALDPNRPVIIRPYAGDDVPALTLDVPNVTTVYAERTFWDKVIILHGTRCWFERREVLRHVGQRVSRHYYDVHRLVESDVAGRAISDVDLATDCARHARLFFGSPDLGLDKACAGSFMLTPVEGMLSDLRRDFERMAGMIIGPVPGFEQVMDSIRRLESRINRPGA